MDILQLSTYETDRTLLCGMRENLITTTKPATPSRCSALAWMEQSHSLNVPLHKIIKRLGTVRKVNSFVLTDGHRRTLIAIEMIFVKLDECIRILTEKGVNPVKPDDHA